VVLCALSGGSYNRSFGGVYPERSRTGSEPALSLSNGTPVRAGPNGTDRVLGDKGRRVMEIFLRIYWTFLLIVRIIDNKMNVEWRI